MNEIKSRKIDVNLFLTCFKKGFLEHFICSAHQVTGFYVHTAMDQNGLSYSGTVVLVSNSVDRVILPAKTMVRIAIQLFLS